MEKFQNVVMTVAIILLIFCMAAIGAIMYYDEKDVAYPPVIANCPDYWREKRRPNGTNVCVPNEDIVFPQIAGEGCLPKDGIDFSTPEYTGRAGNCQKKLWAEKCGFSWDGLTQPPSRNPCKGLA